MKTRYVYSYSLPEIPWVILTKKQDKCLLTFMVQKPRRKKVEVCYVPTTFQAQLNTSSNRRQFLVYRTGVSWTMLFLVWPVYIAYLFMAFLIDGTSIFDDVL